MNFTRKHTYYTLIDTTKDVLIGGDPYLQGQTEVFYTREDAQFGYIIQTYEKTLKGDK